MVVGAVTGSVLAAVVIGALGVRARERNSIIGVLMPFGLGLGVLFLSLYKGRSANKFGLLTGQIVAIDTPQLSWLIVIGRGGAGELLVMWRPLRFASLDPEVAAARGVPVRLLSPIFMLVLGLAIAAFGAGRRRVARAEHRVHPGSGGDAGDGIAEAHRRT